MCVCMSVNVCVRCLYANVYVLVIVMSLKIYVEHIVNLPKLNVILQIYAQAIHVFTSLNVLLKRMDTNVNVNPDTLATAVTRVRPCSQKNFGNSQH